MPEANEAANPRALAGPQPGPRLEISPAPLDFGGVGVGEVGLVDFTFRNSGTNAFRVTRMTIQNGVFAGVLPTGPFGLDPGGTALGRMSFRPPWAGDFTGVLRVFVNNEADPHMAVELRGKGLVPKLLLKTEELDFGEVRYGETKELYFALGNGGPVNLRIKSVAFNTSGVNQYALVQPGIPTTVPPYETAKFFLRLSPDPDGGPITEFVFETNDPENPKAAVRLVHRVKFDFDVVAREGDVLPDGSAIEWLARAPSLNDAGEVAVVAGLTSGRQTVLASRNGRLEDRIALASDLNPAFGTHFDLRHNFNFDAPVQINNAGQIAFRVWSEDGLFAFIVRSDRTPPRLWTVAQSNYERLDFPWQNLTSPFDYAFPFPSRALSPVAQPQQRRPSGLLRGA